MRGRLTSHRFRRRLAWTLAPLALAGTAVAVAIHLGNTGKRRETHFRNEPAWVYREPKLHRLTGAERTRLVDTMERFVRTAVARKDLDSAWPMLGPDLRAGMTRREWDSGDNTVIPYRAVGISHLSVLYSYDGDVAFDVSLLGARSEDTIAKTFTIELRRAPRRDRWIVASWVPKGVSSPEMSRAARRLPPVPDSRAPLSAKWLLFPLSILALILLTPIALALRSLVESRRAARRYAQELALYRSSSSPS
jgi:hypothetical protein